MRRVLVIDDDPDILTVIGITLRARGGFEVELCASGGEALAAARRFAPDLILLDVMMPGTDGPATLQTLRDNPETAATPVVFMTARTFKHERERYLALGAAGVIAKPFDQRTLVNELAEIVRSSASSASEDDPRQMATLLDAYTAALPAKLHEIRDLWERIAAHLDAEAAHTLYRRVHSLAGTAATYGHRSLGDLARQLEQVIAEQVLENGKRDGAQPIPDTAKAATDLIDALEAAVHSGREP